MKPFARSDRIGNRIQSALSDLIRRKINDPRLEMATITGVKVTPDLREADIFFTTSGGEKSQKDAMDAFTGSTGFFRKTLAGQLKLRYMPKLRFVHDGSFDYGARINSVLKELKKDPES